MVIEAESDAAAIVKAKDAAKAVMESFAQPEHIDNERRQGIIAYVDRVAPDDRVSVAEDMSFDDDRI